MTSKIHSILNISATFIKKSSILNVLQLAVIDGVVGLYQSGQYERKNTKKTIEINLRNETFGGYYLDSTFCVTGVIISPIIIKNNLFFPFKFD